MFTCFHYFVGVIRVSTGKTNTSIKNWAPTMTFITMEDYNYRLIVRFFTNELNFQVSVPVQANTGMLKTSLTYFNVNIFHCVPSTFVSVQCFVFLYNLYSAPCCVGFEFFLNTSWGWKSISKLGVRFWLVLLLSKSPPD